MSAGSETAAAPAGEGLIQGQAVPGRDSPAARRGLYYTPSNAFTFSQPEVPCHVFLAERDQALAADAPGGAIALDLGARLGCPFPATTPLLLMRYLRLGAGERLATAFQASGEIYYVLRGRGATRCAGESLAWAEGDLFALPGGDGTHAAEEDALLYVATDEPLLAFLGARAPAPRTAEAEAGAAVEPVLYPSEEISRQAERLCAVRGHENIAGKAVLFTSQATHAMRTCLPHVSVGLNIFEPGDEQLAHRHNAVAVTLCLQARPGMHSLIAGRRLDWHAGAVMITPPTASHSHHNYSDGVARSLVIQDSGLYYHTRAVGFDFV